VVAPDLVRNSEPKSALELIENGDEFQRPAALDSVACREDAEVAPVQKENDRHLRRLIADAIRWQETLERLVELRQGATGSTVDTASTVAKQDWRQPAANVRRYAVESTDPDTKQALIELAQSYDKLAQRDADLDR
jgi:hypothetical protein